MTKQGDLFYDNGRFFEALHIGRHKQLTDREYWKRIASGLYRKVILKSFIYSINGAVPNYLWRFI